MELSKLAVSGIKWSSVSQAGKQIIQYITTIMLASILSPTDFGIIAMAMVVIGFLEIFKDLGTSAAIIHIQETTEELLSSIFFTNVFFGLLIAATIILLSPFISEFYNSPKLISVLNVLAIGFFISGFSIVQKSVMEKELKFNKISIIELLSALIGAITGLILALNDFGVWSLVFQSLVNNFFLSFLYLIICNWKPSLKYRFNSIVKIFKYSSNLIGYNIFNYWVRNADYLLIGKFLGDKDLGHYYIAYKIMLYPVNNISVIISRVMFPIYSRIQSNLQRFRDIYMKVGNSIAFITFPLMLGLISTSNLIAKIFFANNWNTGVISQLIIILAPVGLIQSIASTTGSIYQATGRTDWMFKWGIFSGVIYVGGFVIGVNYGITGVAISYLITTFILLYPVFAIPFKIIQQKFIVFINSFLKIIISSIIMSVLIYLFRYLILFNLDYIEQLVLLILIGLLGYLTFMILMDRKRITDFYSIITS